MRLQRVPALATLLFATFGVAVPSLHAQQPTASKPAAPPPAAPAPAAKPTPPKAPLPKIATEPAARRDTGGTVAAVTHTVKRGDTLWDIAKYYLKDPFRWPQVFHANTDIVKNPHWIYPGQVLTIEASAVKPEVMAKAADSGIVVTQIQTRAQSPTVFANSGVGDRGGRDIGSIAKPASLTVRPGEFEAAPYVEDARHSDGAGKLVGAVESFALGLSSDAGYRLYDRIYITGPASAPLAPGQRLITATATEVIADVGRVIQPTAIVRVDSVNSSGLGIATIIKQFGTVVPKQVVLPLDQSFEPTTVRAVHGSYGETAKLLWIRGEPALPSTQTYIVLSTTASAGIRPGDQFTLYDDRKVDDRADTPPLATATATVVRVTPFGASAIIVDQSQPHVRTGMPAHLTAKMP